MMAKAIHWMTPRIGRFTSLDYFSLSYLSQGSILQDVLVLRPRGPSHHVRSLIKTAQNEIEKFKVEVKRLKAESHHKQSEIWVVTERPALIGCKLYYIILLICSIRSKSLEQNRKFELFESGAKSDLDT